jgi:thioredoxin-like negative regulator of GroEL
MAVTDDNFDEAVLQSRKLSIVMFWQAGCGFCKVLLHVLIAVARTMPVVNFVVIDADESPQTLRRYDIDAFPALLAFRNGEVVGRRMGAAPIDSITGWIKERMN